MSVIPFFVTGGFLANLSTLPKIVIWLSYVSVYL